MMGERGENGNKENRREGGMTNVICKQIRLLTSHLNAQKMHIPLFSRSYYNAPSPLNVISGVLHFYSVQLLFFCLSSYLELDETISSRMFK